MTIKIEITRTPDFRTCAAIHRNCFDAGWSEQAFADLLTFSSTIALMASLKLPEDATETIAGFAITRKIFDESEIITLAVQPEFRKRGIGRNIVESIIRQAKKDGTRVVFLEVRDSNIAARSLYEQAGFELLSIRKNYYGNSCGTSENAIVMRKIL